MDDTILNFNYPTDTPKIIKVIGVGGGGGNAVTHMYKEGIHDVTFVLCNTDNQALTVRMFLSSYCWDVRSRRDWAQEISRNVR